MIFCGIDTSSSRCGCSETAVLFFKLQIKHTIWTCEPRFVIFFEDYLILKREKIIRKLHISFKY